ncbi:potassium channel family protein [Alcanivoracaceae bacterium MT1]
MLNLKLFLLLVILAQFGFPLTAYGPFWEGLYMVFYAGMLVFGITVARQREQPIWPNLILVIFVLAFAGGVVANPADPVLSLGMYLSIGLFLFSIMLTLLKLIFQRRAADGTELILAAVCVYLLLGGLFTALFGTVESLQPGSFVDNATPDNLITWQELLYYSYVTLATLGYGEILPVNPWARSLAILETVIGTLYIATVIARLVGLYASNPSGKGDA